MSLSLGQARWLIGFMRNLPAEKNPPTPEEHAAYLDAMSAQEQMSGMNLLEPSEEEWD
jgi:hypothetical protein